MTGRALTYPHRTLLFGRDCDLGMRARQVSDCRLATAALNPVDPLDPILKGPATARMRDLKQTGFTDRLNAQQEAKKALLAKFKPKPAAPDPEFDKLAAKREAEKEALRQQHELAKAEARREKAAKEAARLEAERQAQEAIDAEKRAARKERKQLTKEEQKAARDARYAARKARQR